MWGDEILNITLKCYFVCDIHHVYGFSELIFGCIFGDLNSTNHITILHTYKHIDYQYSKEPIYAIHSTISAQQKASRKLYIWEILVYIY